MRKLKLVFGVLFAFLLILATNLIDKNNFERLQSSVNAIYQDHMVSKDIMYDLTVHIHEKDLANAMSDSAFYIGQNKICDKEIDALLLEFGEVSMTDKETRAYNSLKEDLGKLRVLEAISFNEVTEETRGARLASLTIIKEDLRELSKIQLEEARKDKKMGKKALANVELFTQIEIYLLIFLAIIISLTILLPLKKKRTEEGKA